MEQMQASTLDKTLSTDSKTPRELEGIESVIEDETVDVGSDQPPATDEKSICYDTSQTSSPLPQPDEEPLHEHDNYLIVHFGNKRIAARHIVVSHNNDDNVDSLRSSHGGEGEKQTSSNGTGVMEDSRVSLEGSENIIGDKPVIAVQDEKCEQAKTTQPVSPRHWPVVENVDTRTRHYLCVKCQAKIYFYDDRQSHLQLHQGDFEAVICGICGWFLKAREHSVRHHKSQVHKGVKFGGDEESFNFSCKNCKVQFNNYCQFKHHQEIGCPSRNQK